MRDIRKSQKSDKSFNFEKFVTGILWEDGLSLVPMNSVPNDDFGRSLKEDWGNYFGVLPIIEATFSIKDFSSNEIEKFLKEKNFCVYNQSNVEEREGKDVRRKSYWINHKYKTIIRVCYYLSGESVLEIIALNEVSHKDFLIPLFKSLYDDFYHFYSDEDLPTFEMIIATKGGMQTIEIESKPVPIKDNRFDLFYGADFPFKKILGFFESPDNLMLLHGPPGTGKSNFIKNILKETNKDVIYIPPNMLTMVSSPEFIPFLIQQRGKVLLIEDAEQILTEDRNSATNNLLGMTDGFLKDALDLKVICTFNTDIKNIDDALLRKGRMYLEYKFGKLSAGEANKLSEFMGMKSRFMGEVSLAEVFNAEHENSESKLQHSPQIGFGAF